MSFDPVSYMMGKKGDGVPIHGDIISYMMGKIVGGGGDEGRTLLDRWDFTSETPLIGKVGGGEASIKNVTFDSQGAHITSYAAYIQAPSTGNYGVINNDIIDYDVKIKTLNLQVGTTARAITTTDNGLTYRNSGVWAIRNPASWKDSMLDDPTALDGYTVTIRIKYGGGSGTSWKIYRNRTLWWDASTTMNLSAIRIGSNTDSIKGAVIESLAIYKVNEEDSA